MDSDGSAETQHDHVGYWAIFLLWLPLGLSRMMMNIAGPIVNAGIARLPDATVNLAAYGLVHDMAVLIESPIIMILSASVALARHRAAYLLLRRFVLHITMVLVAVSILIAFTPLYDVVFGQLLGASPEVVAAARPAMMIMVLWPPAIGWRRLYQGIIIQYGRSRLITYGTVLRLAALTLTVWAGVVLGGLSGAVLGALALVISVVVELGIILWWSLPMVRRYVLTNRAGADGEALTYRSLVRFYWPLAGTEFMRVLARPITAAGVARAGLPTLSLAAWPVGMSLAFLFASAVMSIQEVVVARLDSDVAQRRLARFAAGIGIVLSLVLAIIVFTPLAEWYFGVLLDLPEAVQVLALPTVRVLVALPLIFAARDFLRGVLIHRRRSGKVQAAMVANLAVLIVLLSVGILLGGISGALLAAVATLCAYLLEVALLRWLARDS